ncbi:MAG: hypothetical protein RI894_2555, partial [Bacteroidota bacterium]
MNYFSKLYHHSPSLAWFVGFFAFGSVFFNSIGLQTTPFYVWGMFSEQTPLANTPEIYLIIADKDTIDYTGFATSNMVRTIIGGSIAFDDELRKKHEHPLRSWLKNKLHDHYLFLKPIAEAITTDTTTAQKPFDEWLQRYV